MYFCLLKKILGTYSGLKNKLETTATTHESITQYELTDWDFLNIRAEANGQIVLVNNGEISVKTPKTTWPWHTVSEHTIASHVLSYAESVMQEA